MKKALLTLITTLVLAGCSEPTIDASSDKAMKESISSVKQALPEAKREEFQEALQVLVFSDFDFSDLMQAGFDPEEKKTEMRQQLDGMTGEEVIAKADQVLKERRKRERKQALQEIEELENKRQQHQEAQEKLEDFKVTRSRYYIREGDFTDEPIIELDVVNGTDSPVSRAYFEGVVASPDRSVPWIEERFNYEIAGGVEPGEEVSWTLGLNQFTAWGQTDVPDDAVLTVTPIRLDGPDGEPLFNADPFTEADRNRLKELKSEYAK